MKASTLKEGRGDERKAKDLEVRRKITQKEDRKEERRVRCRGRQRRRRMMCPWGSVWTQAGHGFVQSAKQKMQSHISFASKVPIAIPKEAPKKLLRQAVNHLLTGEEKKTKRRRIIGRGKQKRKLEERRWRDERRH